MESRKGKALTTNWKKKHMQQTLESKRYIHPPRNQTTTRSTTYFLSLQVGITRSTSHKYLYSNEPPNQTKPGVLHFHSLNCTWASNRVSMFDQNVVKIFLSQSYWAVGGMIQLHPRNFRTWRKEEPTCIRVNTILYISAYVRTNTSLKNHNVPV